MSAITEEEVQLLKRFRHRIIDLRLDKQLSPDYELVRWIRARDNDLDAAEKMFRTSLQWRKEKDIDNILAWDPSPEYRKSKPYHVGVTRANGVFIILVPGRVDLRPVVANDENKQMLLRYVNRCWEEVALKMEGRVNPNGTPVTQVTVIIDFKGFSLASAMSFAILGLMKEICEQFDANQPERLESGIIMNGYTLNILRIYNDASKLITILLSFLKSVLASKTAEKLVVLDSDPTKCTASLLGLISEMELPIVYGGKQVDSLLNQFL